MTDQITVPKQTWDAMREALNKLLKRDQRNTCQHEETHRGGAIWEICKGCGAKWADDRGGKPKWKDPSEWSEADAVLTAANAVEPNFSDQATIAGLEASTGHLSALVNEQLLLLEEVNENLGVDGLGAELDDDQSPTIAKVRAHLAAMAPPTRPAVQPQPMAYAVFSSKGNIRIWGHSPDVVKRIKAEFGSSLIALYAHPQATEPAPEAKQ